MTMRKAPYLIALAATALLGTEAVAQTLKGSVELAKVDNPKENVLLRATGGYNGPVKLDTFMDVYGGQEGGVEYFGKLFVTKSLAEKGFLKNVSARGEVNYTTGKATRFRVGVKLDGKRTLGKHEVSVKLGVMPFCYDTSGPMKQTTIQTFVGYAWHRIYAEHWSQYNWNYENPNILVHELTAGVMITPYLGFQGQLAHNANSPGTTYTFGVRIKK